MPKLWMWSLKFVSIFFCKTNLLFLVHGEYVWFTRFSLTGPQDFSTYVQVTQVERAGIDLGTTGYNGNVGIYIPSYLLQQYPDWSLDFWRFLLRSEYRSIFPASGTGPNMKVNGSLVCDNMPGLCMNGTYTPQACNKTSNSCIELWHYHPSLSASMFQRIIDGLKLPVTINFLGNGERATLDSRSNQQEGGCIVLWMDADSFHCE
ncbi:hypothetical protein BDR26DRAFT_505430 [Obelidium mucronatum]|nr:hypothetical protein BDR26DRAFT_505430 [Obelidium mucronatum]